MNANAIWIVWSTGDGDDNGDDDDYIYDLN